MELTPPGIRRHTGVKGGRRGGVFLLGAPRMGCGHCGTGGVWEAYPVGRGSLVAWNRYSAPGWHRLAGDWEGFCGRPGVPGSTSPAIRIDAGLIAREEPSSSGPQTSPHAVDENGRKSLLSRRLYSAECLRSRAFFGRAHTPSQGLTSRLPDPWLPSSRHSPRARRLSAFTRWRRRLSCATHAPPCRCSRRKDARNAIFSLGFEGRTRRNWKDYAGRFPDVWSE
jgi:hypothetical protein